MQTISVSLMYNKTSRRALSASSVIVVLLEEATTEQMDLRHQMIPLKDVRCSYGAFHTNSAIPAIAATLATLDSHKAPATLVTL